MEKFGPDHRAYVAQVVAAQTGMSEADARKRVDQVVTSEASADKARKGAAHLSFGSSLAPVRRVRREPRSVEGGGSAMAPGTIASSPHGSKELSSWAEAFCFGSWASRCRSFFCSRYFGTDDTPIYDTIYSKDQRRSIPTKRGWICFARNNEAGKSHA